MKSQILHSVQFILLFIILGAASIMKGATINITNAGLTFVPDAITIEIGDTVIWQVGSTHNVVEVSESTWQSNGTMSNGGFELPFGGGMVVFDIPGEFYYVCQPHAGQSMKGRILVSGPMPTEERFIAFLGGANEAPQRYSAGRGVVTATLSGDTLVLNGEFNSMLSSFNAAIAGGAHIHNALAGSNGGVEFVLTTALEADQRSGRFDANDNVFVLNETQKEALRTRSLYINIHSTLYEAGELRGQLVPESDAYYGANLMGVYQTPAVVTDAFGSVVAQRNGNELVISGSFSGLSTNLDTALFGGAHIHVGFAGSNGGVAFPLQVTAGPDLRGGRFEAGNNTFTLDTGQLIQLDERGLYINIHSIGYPAGELRGQIRGPAHTVFRAHLTGMNQNPPVMTGAQGMLIMEHQDSMISISGSLDGLESPIDTLILGGTHVHVGLAGSNGQVLRPLETAFQTGELTRANYLATRNTFLINNQVNTLLAFRFLYANVHTVNNQSGELRGQFLPEANQYFYARLTGGQQTQDIATTGNGQVIGELNDGLMTFSGSLDLMSDVDYEILGGIHVHQALAGADGPVLFGLNLTPMEDDTTRGDLLSLNNIYQVPALFIDTLRQRSLYVNVHSDDYSAGEVRGQLLGEATNYFYAPLSGSSQTSPEDNDGRGSIVLEENRSTLTASGSFENLESAFDPSIAGGAHLHYGMAGQDGPVLHFINASLGADLTEGQFWANQNRIDITADFLDTLRNRAVYVNLHTEDVPSGSVRGNALGLSQMYFTTTLGGINEIQPDTSRGFGAMKIELDNNRMVASGSFQNLNGPFDPTIAGGSHLHVGGPEVNGGVLTTLLPNLQNDSLGGRFMPSNNTFILTNNDILDALSNENGYINIHSRAVASGELRGQILIETNVFPNRSVIIFPPAADTITIEGDPETQFNAAYDNAVDLDGNKVVYIWQLSRNPDFSDVMLSVNTGTMTSFETDYGVIDNLLENNGILINSTTMLFHRVLTSDGAVQVASSPRSVFLTRGIVSSTTNLEAGIFSLSLFPNPVSSKVQVEIVSPTSGRLNIQIVDLKGQQVAELTDEIIEGNLSNYVLPLNNVSAGTYIVQPVINGKLLTAEKMIKL